MSVRLYGQLESEGDRLVVRVLGHRLGTADGWFHWDGWTIVAAGFKSEEGFARFFPELVVVEPLEPGGPTTLALMVDYYTGQIALVEMSAKDAIAREPRVIAEAHIAV